MKPRRPARRWLLLWVLLLAGVWLWARLRGVPVPELLQALLRWSAQSPWAPWLLLAAFLVRPLLLLPITVLSVFTGYLFGPVLGFATALAGTLLSSSLAYGVGRRFAGRRSAESATRLPSALRGLHERAFETVLSARLLFVPGDLVNYAAGALRVSFLAFLAATALGGAPGLLVSVLAGASLEGEFRFEGLTLEPAYLLASLALLGGSLGLARVLRRRRAR